MLFARDRNFSAVVMDTADDVLSFLKAHGLEQFAHKGVELGYDSVQLLFALEPREVDELIKNAGMLSGFAAKMRRALLSAAPNDAAPAAAAAAAAAHAEDAGSAGAAGAAPVPPPAAPPPPPEAAPADLQAHLVSALHSTGTIGTYVHGNLHAVYASSSLAQPCITIFPNKRFGCSVCPLNPKSDHDVCAV